VPGSRQQCQQKSLTSEKTGKHEVSGRQHRQHNPERQQTLLTAADTHQHSEPAAQRILLTLLTLTAPPADQNSHRTKGD
jgi:hypothetical protein